MRHNVTTNDLLSLIGFAMMVPILVTASGMALFVVQETGLGIVLSILSLMMLYALNGGYSEMRTKLGIR